MPTVDVYKRQGLQRNITMLLSRITQFLSLQLLQSTDNTETCVARFNYIVDVAIFSCIVRIGEQFRVFCLDVYKRQVVPLSKLEA